MKGRGSAIFIHRWRKNGYPTEGCIALSKENLLKVAKFIDFWNQTYCSRDFTRSPKMAEPTRI